MNNTSFLARKYALAFTHSFAADFTKEDIEQIAHAYQFFVAHKRFSYLLNLPTINKALKQDALEKILIGQFHLPTQPCKALINLLIAHHRTQLMGTILHIVHELMMKEKNIEAFTISSAQPLTQEQQTELEQFLVHTTTKTIVPTYTVNKDLIAGLRVQSNAHLWEHSLKKYLRTLNRTITR